MMPGNCVSVYRRSDRVEESFTLLSLGRSANATARILGKEAYRDTVGFSRKIVDYCTRPDEKDQNY